MYEKMPQDIKAIIDGLGPKFSAVSGAYHDKYAQDAISFLKGAGGTQYELLPADMEKIGKLMIQNKRRFLSKM